MDRQPGARCEVAPSVALSRDQWSLTSSAPFTLPESLSNGVSHNINLSLVREELPSGQKTLVVVTDAAVATRLGTRSRDRSRTRCGPGGRWARRRRTGPWSHSACAGRTRLGTDKIGHGQGLRGIASDGERWARAGPTQGARAGREPTEPSAAQPRGQPAACRGSDAPIKADQPTRNTASFSGTTLPSDSNQACTCSSRAPTLTPADLSPDPAPALHQPRPSVAPHS